MILGVGLLTVNDGLAKYLTKSYPVGQVLCLRHLAVLLVMLPWVTALGRVRELRVHDRAGQALRGLLFIAGTSLLVFAVEVLPLATVTSIHMAAPLFVGALSAPLLGERVGARRWLAILAGLAGVLIILRPGGQAFAWVLLLPVGAALANGLRDISTRHLARTETSLSVLFWSNAAIIPAMLITLPLGWAPVDVRGALWFALAGILNAAAHFLVIEAMRFGEASLIAPYRYTAVLWAVVIGYLVWGHVPDAAVIAGAVVIAGSGIAMIFEEARRRRGAP